MRIGISRPLAAVVTACLVASAPALAVEKKSLDTKPEKLGESVMSGPARADMLLNWEMARLRADGSDLKLVAAAQKELAKYARAGESVPERIAAEWVAALRLANQKHGAAPGAESRIVLKSMVQSELNGVLGDLGEGALALPPDLVKMFAPSLKGTKEGFSAKGLAKALKDFAPQAIETADWMQLLGRVRLEGLRLRGDGFASEVRRDFARDFGRRAARSGGGTGATATPNPPVTFEADWPKEFSIASFGSGRGAGATRGHQARGFEEIIPPSSEGADGGRVVLSGEPRDISLTESQRKGLLEQRKKGHMSLDLVIAFAEGDTLVKKKCQGTIVDEPEDLTNGTCKYQLATAAHCVLNRRRDGSKRLFDELAVIPFGEVKVTRRAIDREFGGDMAMVTFEAACRNKVPWVKMAQYPPQNNEPISVYGHMHYVGQAQEVMSGGALMAMNVRDRERNVNFGLGIDQGNSGGAVVNKRGELVGVISSKLEDPYFQGIGFFATKGSLQWANKYMGGVPLASTGGKKPPETPIHAGAPANF